MATRSRRQKDTMWSRAWVKSTVILFGVVVLGVSYQVHASSSVIPRINEALRVAEIPVTPANQMAWMTCVVARHINCISYESLIDSMTWHRQQFDAGLRDAVVPDAAKFISTLVRPITEPVKTATGTVVSYNAPPSCDASSKTGQVTITISAYNHLQFRLPCDTSVDAAVQVGTTVNITYRGQGSIRTGLHVARASTSSRGIGSDGGDCPTCGNDNGSGYGS